MAEQLTKQKLYSSFSWSFLDQFLTFGISFIVQIVVARILEPSAYGIIAIVLIFINIANALAMSGFSSALIQKAKINSADYDSAFWVSELFSLTLYAIIFASAPLISEFYEIENLMLYVRVFAIVLFFNAFNAIQRAYLQRTFNFKSTFIASLITAIVSGVIGIALAVLQFGVWAIIAQSLSAAITTCIAFMVFVPWKPRFRFNFKKAIDLFSYGWKLALTGIINSLSDSFVDTVIGKYVSTANLGYYTQGKRYPVIAATLIQNPLSNVLFPTLSALQEKPNEIKRLMRQGLQIGSFLIVPAMFLLALVGEPLVSVLLTDKWLPCVPVLQAFCLIYSCLLIETMNIRVYAALGRSDIYLYLHIGRAALSVLVSVTAVVLSRNIYVLALCFALTQTIYIILIEAYPAKKLCGYPPMEQLKDVAPIYTFAAIAFIACVPLLLTPLGSMMKILLLATTFAIVYLVLSYLFKLPGLAFSRTELSNLGRIISDKRRVRRSQKRN